MQGRPLRSVPVQLREAVVVRSPLERRATPRSVAAAVPEDARRIGLAWGDHTRMGCAAAGVAPQVDFALVGHPESWRAAAEVFSALRGPERTRLPDEEIKDILPWIPPRAVCRVEVKSMAGAEAHGLYIDSFIPPDRLDAACVPEHLTRVRAAAAYAIKAGARIVSLGGFSSILLACKF